MKDVMVTVKTVQSDGDQSETLELTAEGKYTAENGAFLITYQDSMLSDEYGPIHTSIAVAKDGAVTISRSGSYQSRFTLKEGKRCDCVYSTPFGAMSMGFFSERIDNRLQATGGELELIYTVDFNRAEVNQNKVFVTVREV